MWADHSLFYLSKMYTEQIEQGQEYIVLKKCVSISILNFKLFSDEKEFYSCFHLRENTCQFLYTDKMEFHLIELPKLPEKLKEDSSNLELWARFINSKRKGDLVMIAEKDPYIKSAYEQLQMINQDKQKRLEYENREKALRDYNQLMWEAEQRGMKCGMERGIEVGGEQINKLNSLLIKDNRYDDLRCAITDKNFQHQLMIEYGIVLNV